jgi:putative ABC transport system permease protein
VLGAGRSQLLKQFLGESFIITLFALVLALLASIFLLPLFNSITGKTFPVALLFNPVSVLAYFALSIIISLIAGAYPALVVSNSKLINILKSGVRVSSSGGGLRKTLIVFQFVISVFLVITTIIVLKQVSFIRHRDPGYHREQVLVLPVDYKMHAVYEPLKTALSRTPGVISISGAYEDPTFIEWGDGITTDDGNGKKELSVTAIPVDIGFIKTMGMQLAAGHDFNENDFALPDSANEHARFKSSFIINEKAARDLGWTPEQAIGKVIERGEPGFIAGVVKDFNFASLHNPIGPLVIFPDTSMVRQLFVKIRAEQLATTLASLEKIWKDRIAWRPFDYHFLDEDFNKLYQAEQRTASLFALFSGLAIALACLGLFALAAFTTVQRTKEIGIRKILGANVASITLLISKQFLLLVLIGILIASPLAWWAGKNWLQDFAYRININGWIFIGAGVMAIFIALITVSYHAVRASLANPVRSLRTE